MIAEEQREQIFAKTKGTCYYCGKKLSFYNRDRLSRGAWEVDHLVAQANGGHQTHLNNLVPACWGCNLDKSTRSSRSHRLAVTANREARDVRRQWRTAEAVILPGLFVAGAVWAYMDANGPNVTEKQMMTPEEHNQRFWKMLLYSIGAGVASIVLLVMISEGLRKV